MLYRYNRKVFEFIKEKSFSGMENKEFLNLFQKNNLFGDKLILFFFIMGKKLLNERYKHFMV